MFIINNASDIRQVCQVCGHAPLSPTLFRTSQIILFLCASLINKVISSGRSRGGRPKTNDHILRKYALECVS